MAIEAVLFDLDGVIVDSETVWHAVRRDFTRANGGHWTEDDQKAVMGANSREWSEYIHDTCGVALPPETIYSEVVSALVAAYRRHLPLLPGAVEAVRALARVYLLAVASSSPRAVVEMVLGLAGLEDSFRAVVSSDEVPHAKPAPDVYLEACRRLGYAPASCAAVEDSTNGIRAALAAGVWVIAVPNRDFPPPPEVIAAAHVVLDSVAGVTPEEVAKLGEGAFHGY